MDGRISMYVLLLVCVWCSLDAGGFMMVVTAQPTVSVMILTPVADRKEGGQVDMRCTARNLEWNHIVEWRTEDPVRSLRWGESTIWNANGRFIFDTSYATQKVVQDFTITNVQRSDTDEYVCNIKDPRPGGGHNIVATSNVTLPVFYFPSESFPVCSPAGPITVDAGTELDMMCSSKSSHGTVTMMINPTIQTSRYTTWTSVINHDNDTVVRKLDLPVDDADKGVSFECVIASMYFPNMLRTCQIGPITVRNTMTIPMTEPTTSTSTSSTTGSTMSSTGISTPNSENGVTSSSSSTSTQSTSELSLSSAVVVGAVAGGVAAFLLIVILILIYCQRRRSGNSDPKSEQSNPDVNQTNTLTPDRLEISQISSNEYGELGSIQHGLQDNIIYASSQSPLSGPGESYSGTVPVQTAETTDPSLLYAKPFRTQTQRTEPAVMKQQSDLSDDSATEQSYSNPAFQSSVSDGTTSPSGDDLSKPIKPTALVRPTRPSKPRPFKPKPAERTSNTQSTQDDRMAPSSPPPTNVNNGTPSPVNTHEASYAQVSVPMRQHSSHGNPGSEDHIVYVKLDLQADEIQDGGHGPPPASEAVLYSSVMRN